MFELKAPDHPLIGGDAVPDHLRLAQIDDALRRLRHCLLDAPPDTRPSIIRRIDAMLDERNQITEAR